MRRCQTIGLFDIRHLAVLTAITSAIMFDVAGIKPKSKGHYRSHKLALWLNLIPDLHRPTGEDVARDHHLLDDYNDPYSYDGKVRLVPATFPAVPTTTPSPMTSAVNSSLLVDSSSNAVKSSGVEASKMNDSHRGLNDLSSRSAEDHFGTYSTALSVTIAIGCSLLILNVLIFAGVYYQRDKQRMELKRRMENGMLSVSISGEMDDRRQQSGPRLCGKPDLADAPSLQRMDANSAASAARRSSFDIPPRCGARHATPMLVVTMGAALEPTFGSPRARTAAQMCSARSDAARSPVFGSTTPNSSPPYRATRSPARRADFCKADATSRRQSSPPVCP